MHLGDTAAHLEALFPGGSLRGSELLAVGDALRLEAGVQLGQALAQQRQAQVHGPTVISASPEKRSSCRCDSIVSCHAAREDRALLPYLLLNSAAFSALIGRRTM